MALAFVQWEDSYILSGDSQVPSGTSAQILNGGATQHNCVVMLIRVFSLTDTVASISSPIGTFSFVGRVQYSLPPNRTDEIWVCFNAASGSPDTATVTMTSGTAWNALGCEVSGGANTAVYQTNGSGSGTSISQSFAGANGAFGLAQVLAVNSITHTGSSTNYGQTAGPWAPAAGGDAAYLAMSGATGTATWTQSSAGNWESSAVVLSVASTLPPRPKGLPAAVRRANNYFKRENGLWEPERGLIVPRVA